MRAGSIAVIVILSLPPMEALLQDRRLVYVTGKGGVGKTTVAAAIGLAAAEAGRRTIVCEVAEQDRVSRAFRREGVTAETEVAARGEPLGDHDRPHQGAAGVARQAARRRRAAADDDPLARVPVLRRRRAGRQGADHDREGVGAGAALALGRAQPHLRPRGRRRARLRPRARDADHAAHVRRDRARRPDPPPGGQDRGPARPTPSARATSRSRCPRRCRWSRRSSSAASSRRPSASGWRRSSSTASGPTRFSAADVKKLARRLRATATTPTAPAACAPRSPSTTGPSSSAATSTRLTKESGTTVVTLPYLFASELGLPEYQLLADELAAVALGSGPGGLHRGEAVLAGDRRAGSRAARGPSCRRSWPPAPQAHTPKRATGGSPRQRQQPPGELGPARDRAAGPQRQLALRAPARPGWRAARETNSRKTTGEPSVTK